MSSPVEARGGEILLYEAPDGSVRVDVRLDHETVWLTQDQMSQLFGRERSVITKHIRNVFREGELEAGAVSAKFAHTADDDKTYQVEHYNLDVIISVGYRVKSTQGTRFRQWATRVLRELLVRGYSFNQTRLANDLLSRTLECRRESRTLAAMRDALLPKLISGEMRVQDAERFLRNRGL